MHELPDTALDFASIVREHSPDLLRYLRRQVGDDADAADLLQETLLKASRGMASYAGRASPRTWLFAIARNVVNDFLRSRPRRHGVVALDEAGDVEDAAHSVEQRIEFGETNRCIREVIDSLPPGYRTALVVHELDELTYEQTAEVLGGSVGAVKVRLHRARQRLKSALERSCEFYRDSNSVLRCERRDASISAAGRAVALRPQTTR
ncbi:MAG: RNA polymerase sigma factor [Gammaproteobacteria bacterium]